MRQSILKAAIAASAWLLANPVSAQTTGLTAAVYQGCYSSSGDFPLTTSSSLTYQYQSTGWCQQQCGDSLKKAVFGLNKGADCYCGDLIPANSTKVSDSECNTPCQGYGTQMCGGSSTFSVYTTGLSSDVEIQDGSAASSSSAPTSTGGSSKGQSQAPTTITQAGKTIVVTATSASTASASSGSSHSPGGTNKAAVAAGAVVGVAAVCAIAGGIFFLIRHRRRRQIEDEHRREQAKSNFVYSGTVKSKSESSNADARLDPSIAYRRESSGSIADERDFTRRVLKVTNPDGA